MPKKGKSKDRITAQKRFERLEKERQRAMKKAEKIAKKLDKGSGESEPPAE